MKLLFLSPFPPRPLYGGAVVRNHHLAQFLARHHEVWASFVGLHGGSEFRDEVPLASAGLAALFDPRFLWRAHQAIKSNKLEAIVATSLIAGLHGAFLKMLTGLPFWMDEHNVEWHCSRRYKHKLWWLIFLLEGFILRWADHVTCVSLEDKQRLCRSFRLAPERVVVAPNGVDYPKLMDANSESEERSTKRVLFFGVLDYPPNREAVEILGRDIAPLVDSDTEILVAGRGGEDLQSRFPGLNFLGFVDDIHALVRSCDGVVVPIMAGGGTRMKILESVACGTPVVSTTCGAEGIELKALGDGITIREEPEAMAKWVNDLEIGKTATLPARFSELYDWATIWQNKAPL